MVQNPDFFFHPCALTCKCPWSSPIIVQPAVLLWHRDDCQQLHPGKQIPHCPSPTFFLQNLPTFQGLLPAETHFQESDFIGCEQQKQNTDPQKSLVVIPSAQGEFRSRRCVLETLLQHKGIESAGVSSEGVIGGYSVEFRIFRMKAAVLMHRPPHQGFCL